jgi:hypothetical protein
MKTLFDEIPQLCENCGGARFPITEGVCQLCLDHENEVAELRAALEATSPSVISALRQVLRSYRGLSLGEYGDGLFREIEGIVDDREPVPAPRLSKGELVEIWCKAQYEGRMRELIALYGPESPYVEMYEGGWETCDRASKESNRRSATYIIDALENINAVLSPPVGTQE